MLKFFLLGMLGYVILCSIIQVCVTLRLLAVFRARVEPSHDFDFPKAAIILAIRGPDPSLERNIRALLAQAYPNYKLFVVVDHVEDPAWQIVEKIRDEIPDRVQVSVLKEPLSTCSLKCSAMAQAVTNWMQATKLSHSPMATCSLTKLGSVNWWSLWLTQVLGFLLVTGGICRATAALDQ
jgi:cellulose synthase/poly-beta-1,6-N-acetylglucosamine synthase-like glycosyltransferase